MTKFKGFMGLVAVAAVSIGTAHADVIETGSIASQGASAYNYPGANVVLAQYDTLSLPTLNALILTVKTSEAANVAVNNVSGTDYGFTNGTATVIIGLTGPGGLSTYLNTVATVSMGTALGNSITNFAGLTGPTTFTTTITGASLATYEGPGTVTLNFLGITGSGSFNGTSSAPSNTLFFGGGANIGVDVTADFVNAPEPASLALLGSALAGIGFIRRRARGR
jgi:hypothetical protein